MKQATNFFLGLLFMTLLNSCFTDNAGVINVVSVEEAAELMDLNEVKVIDVRSEIQYSSKHINKAINIEVENDDLNAILDEMDKNEPLLVYCNKGGQSERCAKVLQEKGFKLIYDLDGGIAKWEESGREVIVKN
ncbi:rhodanese-like domain-containing protein [Nonlabens dokdonensis]|uniref:Metallo-beta-lactamase n=2 Tax=Nonlabens dokdonensis TaxID=328515 RepID=L7W5R0_NONDD|nr:rhodanese-like domain-containing protein [Nonlabens dokdonensis]AGC75434.1 metallo-beta-lactamase [Nonlabens dokdonensis DSW-6]